MINCLTISKFQQPLEIINELGTEINYNFIYEDIYFYKQFITNNPTDGYTLDLFNKITNGFIQKMVFILYYLYICGGIYFDMKVVPTKDIKQINFDSFSLFSVKSLFSESSLFLGIIGCKQKDENVFKLIHDLTNSSDITSSHDIFVYDKIIKLKNVLLLNEKRMLDGCVSTVNDENVILFNHYFDDKYIYKFPLEKKGPFIKNPGKIKIGITLNVFNNINKFCSNGINQNSLYLCELLLNAGFDVFFICLDQTLINISDEILKEQLYDDRFKIIKYSNILNAELDILITLSFSDSNTYIFNYLKYKKTKLVGYFCGNSYIIDTEKILYNQHKSTQGNFDVLINETPRFDEIWSIPQMSEINLHYWKILYRCNVISVPFVWSKSAIKLHSIINKCSEDDLLYKPRKKDKKIAIFEPNMSIMKWALPSILICENCYRNYKNINHLYITNINSGSHVDFNMPQFNKFMNNVDLAKDKKCSIESRYNTLEFMKTTADIAVSHQWGNPLNYLYFDLAWLGYPIIHNADLCKDVGYFYEGFNYTEGSELLNNVINDHDTNLDKYIEENRTNINRFLSDNSDLMLKYIELINLLCLK